jgi:methionine-rich copper-binding protein CopC
MKRLSLGVLLLALPRLLVASKPRHLERLSSAPRKDQTVGSAPIDIALIFSESVDSARTTISLQGPGGVVELGPIRLQDEALVVLAKVMRPGSAGTYTVSWNASPPGKTRSRAHSATRFGRSGRRGGVSRLREPAR